MSEAGVASRGRQLCGEVVARLHSHGIEIVPFITVGCLVVGFWCVLSLPAIVEALHLKGKPAPAALHSSVQPHVHVRVIASTGGATLPESRQLPKKRSRERGEMPVPASLHIARR